MTIFLWYLSGLIISSMIWFLLIWGVETYRCPTPRAIVGILFTALAGPLMLSALVGIVIVRIAEFFVNNPKAKWWSVPICGKKGNDQ